MLPVEPVHVGKAIVTDFAALRSKYGSRLGEVRAAIAGLVEADAARGLASVVFDLSDARQMGRLCVDPVDGPGDRRRAKEAVDAIDRFHEPTYILLLGAPDVVPMQLLRNPLSVALVGPGGDDDGMLPSDLPYACEAPYGLSIERFAGPARVVGRLPDMPGARDPGFLLRVLRHATRAKPAPQEAYRRWFALSTQSWLRPSREVLEGVFGSVERRDLHLVPGPGRPWRREVLAPRMHFVNCHGGAFDASFDGEYEALVLPTVTALEAGELGGKVPRGAILVAECCYGGHLYDPLDPRASPLGQRGIALEYLGQGAHGVFASTTTAYGGTVRCENADVLCMRFMQRVLAGASLGRAALEARQDLMDHHHGVDPTLFKTLAQFTLLGDPSIHPVRPGPAIASRRGPRDRFSRHEAGQLAARLRRENLRRMGLALLASFPQLGSPHPPTRLSAHRLVGKVARAMGFEGRDQIEMGIRLFDLSTSAVGLRPRLGRADIRGARQVVMGFRRILGNHDIQIAQLIDGKPTAIRHLVSR